jgi:hypothetical protein
MLCCQNEGLLTPWAYVEAAILCTHPVVSALTCLAVSGPTNLTAFGQFNTDPGKANYNWRWTVNWLGMTNGYNGPVVFDIEATRNDPTRPECSLNLAEPCIQDGNLVTTMAPVTPLNFTAINANAYWQSYLGVPPTNLISSFNWGWMNSTYPGQCMSQATQYIPGSFYNGAWPSYEGYAIPCNATATFDALSQFSVATTLGGVATPSGVAGILPN